jgi:hypothetical protein
MYLPEMVSYDIVVIAKLMSFVISKKLYFKKCDKLSRFSLWYKFARYSP